MNDIRYTPIGTIHSPFKHAAGMPIQSAAAKGIKGTVEVFEKYCAGLKDIGGFSYVILLYHFHLSSGYSLEAQPFLDDAKHGIFSIRAPARPNPIGISIVRLVTVEKCTLHIEDVDVIDGTPLLDIKPYVPDFDFRPAERIGWLTDKLNNLRNL